MFNPSCKPGSGSTSAVSPAPRNQPTRVSRPSRPQPQGVLQRLPEPGRQSDRMPQRLLQQGPATQALGPAVAQTRGAFLPAQSIAPVPDRMVSAVWLQAAERAKASELAHPLNLCLSPEAMRALPVASMPVLSSTGLPLTVEQLIGKTWAAAGSGPWLQERVEAQRVRFRRGERCITYTRPKC